MEGGACSSSLPPPPKWNNLSFSKNCNGLKAIISHYVIMTLIIIKLNGLWRMLENQFSISKNWFEKKRSGIFVLPFLQELLRTSRNSDGRWGEGSLLKSIPSCTRKSVDSTRVSTFYGWQRIIRRRHCTLAAVTSQRGRWPGILCLLMNEHTNPQRRNWTQVWSRLWIQPSICKKSNRQRSALSCSKGCDFEAPPVGSYRLSGSSWVCPKQAALEIQG